MPFNAAAWVLRAKSRPLVVAAGPYKTPPEGHVAIKVLAVAINPIDWIMQEFDIFGASYPAVFGSDVVGEIVEMGEGVGDLEVGQKVIAHANSLSTNDPTHGAFQKRTIVPRLSTAPIPSSIPMTNAVVLPLSISTATAGLYQRHYLHLPLPDPRSQPPPPLNRTVLIWGGSSSVGSTAIQLARASGATVLTTASARNAAYCRRLGATQVYDYHDACVEETIIEALSGSTLAGIYHAAGPDSAVQSCARIASKSKGKALVVTIRAAPKTGIPSDVRVQAISSSDIFKPGNEVGERVWKDYVPEALEKGLLVPAPEPMVVGEGLRSVQHGLDVQRRGVSAAKVVVAKISEETPKTHPRRPRSSWYIPP